MSIAKDTSRQVGLDMVSEVAARTARSIVDIEGVKGCDPSLAETPVDLEPPFGDSPLMSPRCIEHPVVMKVWCPRDLKLMWKQYNDLHKELGVLHHPAAFEIVGNSEAMWVQFVVDKEDLLCLSTATEAEFPTVRLEEQKDDAVKGWLARGDRHCELADYYPHPPYYRTMTVHETIGGSPLDPVYVTLKDLRREEFGVYRIIFVPARPEHNWHKRVNGFTDAEYRGTQDSFFNPAIPNYYHQLPSQYLPMISQREEQKAHPDRPFFGAAVFTIALSPDASRPGIILRAMRTALSHFLYGTRLLAHIGKTPYTAQLGSEGKMRAFLMRRAVLRPGMLLNSLELSGLCHFPPGVLLDDNEAPLHRIEGFEVHESLRSGRLLMGHNKYMGKPVPVFVPDGITNEHAYFIGKPGVGKSTTLENLILQEVEQGRGVGLIEPHGDLTWSVLKRIPRHRIKDVVFLDPHDASHVPCLNPFDPSEHEDRDRLADELTCAFRAGLESAWGYRMENILRQACYALLHVPGSTMADMSLLLSQTADGESFRNRMLSNLRNADAISFWRDRFIKYRPADIDPVTNKVSKLMLNTKIAAMFSQRRALIRWRAIMDEGKVFLANLTGLGSGNTEFLGSLFIAGFKEAACSRSDQTPADRRPFSLYVDEFYRFPTTSLDDLLTESRKFNMALRLAHQETGQIDYETRRAVGTADTIVSFCVDVDDAKHIVRELRKEVREEDLLDLSVGEAYARINNHVVDLTTLPPPSDPGTDSTPDIVDFSRRHYSVPRTSASDHSPIHRSLLVRIFETFKNGIKGRR